jgi:thiol:disulfide interchange protein DsbC
MDWMRALARMTRVQAVMRESTVAARARGNRDPSMMTKLLFALAASLATAGACAAAQAAAADARTARVDAAAPNAANAQAEQRVRAAVASLAKVRIDSISPAALPGFYQVITSGQMVYVSADGKYMLHGDIVDLAAQNNLTDAAWEDFRKAELAKLPAAQRLVFAPAHPKYRITVFTDVNCGYCRALHEHMAEMNKLGIAVDYLAWPREGVTTTAGNDTPTYTEMTSVWCAADRQAAFTAATAGKAPKAAPCANPVKDQFDLGVRLGVTGTPTIIDEAGRVLGGYLPPDKLLQMLQQDAHAD